MSCLSLRQSLDHVDDLVTLIPASSGKIDKLTRFAEDGTLLRASCNCHTATPPELQDSFVAEDPQCPEHDIGMDPKNSGHVLRGREALADGYITVCDVATNLSGDLIMEGKTRISPLLDTSHGDRQSITIMLEGST